MRLTNLSANPNKPCYMVHVRGLNLLLDCGLDLSSTLSFLPLPLVPSAKLSSLAAFNFKDENNDNVEWELKEAPHQARAFVDSVPEFVSPSLSGLVDLSSIDAILLSNYTCMLALPFITEGTGFKGRVYATEPTMTFGRLFMEETIEYVERSSKGQRASRWKAVCKALPSPLCDAENPQSWRTIFSREKLESCLSKVTLVGYSEKVDVFGLVQVSPVSAGYCIGSSNWIIASESSGVRIGYVSGSSTLATHPKPFDKTSLKGVDCLLLTSLTMTPLHNPNPMIGEFCQTVCDTIRQGGNVLVPCYPSGIIYDLIECLHGQLDMNGLTTTSMFFLSPVADSSLAYANIMAEWLSANKQSKVYIPEEPFIHGHLSRSARLKSFRSLHDENFSNEYRQPCVMFCGHPSLRFGDVIHFIELWGSSPNNAVVFTEPSFNYLTALAPFQPLMMKTVHCPIDTSVNFTQAKKLIREINPGCIAIPECYARPPPSAPTRTDLTVEAAADVPIHTFGRHETIKIPVKSERETIRIDPDLASSLTPSELRPGVAVATLTGDLKAKDNKYELRQLKDPPPREIPAKRKRDHRGTALAQAGDASTLVPAKSRCPSEYTFGKLNVREFVQRLQAVGFADARVEGGDDGSEYTIIHLEAEETLIQCEPGQTHVVCDGRDREVVRKKIRDALVSCLSKF